MIDPGRGPRGYTGSRSRRLVAALGLASVAATAALGGGPPGPPASVGEVLRRHADRLLRLPGVVGVAEGLCKGQPCIKVFVTKATPEVVQRVPAEVEGIPVSVEETGAFRPQRP